jgi:hypothetical protein
MTGFVGVLARHRDVNDMSSRTNRDDQKPTTEAALDNDAVLVKVAARSKPRLPAGRASKRFNGLDGLLTFGCMATRTFVVAELLDGHRSSEAARPVRADRCPTARPDGVRSSGEVGARRADCAWRYRCVTGTEGRTGFRKRIVRQRAGVGGDDSGRRTERLE